MKRVNIGGLVFLGTIGLCVGGVGLNTNARVSKTLDVVNQLIDLGIKSTTQQIINGNMRINNENLKKVRDRAVENAKRTNYKSYLKKDLNSK